MQLVSINISNIRLCHTTVYLFGNLGCWVLLDKATREKYCFNVDGEAWSMAIGTNNVLYLDSATESDDPKVRFNTSLDLHTDPKNIVGAVGKSKTRLSIYLSQIK